ncbi:hypothetical protein KI387_004303, partial [Taxus chinensis]
KSLSMPLININHNQMSPGTSSIAFVDVRISVSGCNELRRVGGRLVSRGTTITNLNAQGHDWWIDIEQNIEQLVEI